MATIHSKDAHRAASIEPLLVRPAAAWKMLGCGNTRGYQLITSGELESFLDGRSRKITVASIKRYIQRRLSAAATGGPTQEPAPRRRGRPRKVPVSA